jgi:hypothetical protein
MSGSPHREQKRAALSAAQTRIVGTRSLHPYYSSACFDWISMCLDEMVWALLTSSLWYRFRANFFSSLLAAIVVGVITEYFARRRFRVEKFERLRRELRDDPRLLAVKEKLAPWVKH